MRPEFLQTAKAGVSLIEVMVAVAVVATGLMISFGYIGSLKLSQESTEARQLRSIAVRNIANLYAGAGVEEISAWHANGDPRGLPALDNGAYATIEHLSNRNLISAQVGNAEPAGFQRHRELRFGVGFYRVMDNIEIPGTGFWGSQDGNSLRTAVQQLQDWSNELEENRKRRAAWRVTDPNDDAQVDAKMPVAVLVMCYLDDEIGRQPLEVVTTMVARR